MLTSTCGWLFVCLLFFGYPFQVASTSAFLLIFSPVGWSWAFVSFESLTFETPCYNHWHCHSGFSVTFYHLYFYQLAEQIFKEALGAGVWLYIMDGRIPNSSMYSSASTDQYKDMKLFHQLEEDGVSLELPWDKVTTLFNHARLLEQLHNTEKASILYQLILFKASFLTSYVYVHYVIPSHHYFRLSTRVTY